MVDFAGNPYMRGSRYQLIPEQRTDSRLRLIPANGAGARTSPAPGFDVKPPAEQTAPPAFGANPNNIGNVRPVGTIADALLCPKAAQAIFGHKFDQILHWGLSGANEKVYERLLEVMADPKVAAALMKKATEGNANMAMPLLERALSGLAVAELPARTAAR
jgi:hypothetical protein